MGHGRQIALMLLAACLFTGSREESVAADAPAELEERRYIALTFDDGPKAGTTDVLLDGLRRRGASATFFLIGRQIAENADLVRRMAAEGHQIGNHTWNHVRLRGQAPEALLAELEQTNRTLEALLGEGTYWVRPPYGDIDQAEKSLIDAPLIKWSVDTRDWESLDPEKIVAHVLAEAESGSIILMHDIYPTSVDAALEIVDRLQADGYWFVTVEELFALEGVEPETGVLYSRVPK